MPPTEEFNTFLELVGRAAAVWFPTSDDAEPGGEFSRLETRAVGIVEEPRISLVTAPDGRFCIETEAVDTVEERMISLVTEPVGGVSIQTEEVLADLSAYLARASF